VPSRKFECTAAFHDGGGSAGFRARCGSDQQPQVFPRRGAQKFGCRTHVVHSFIEPEIVAVWINACSDSANANAKIPSPMEDRTAQTPTPDHQLFRDVFNASPIGIAVENLEGQPLFVNPAFCSMLGFSEEEMCTKHCIQFSPPEDAEKDWALFQQLRAGAIDHYQLQKRYFRRDGSLLWGRLSISLLNGRPSPLVIAMVEDITDKRTAEEARRNSEERFRLAAQAGKMFAYEWDVATDVVVRSGDVADVLGPGSDAPLTRQQILARVHPDDKALFAASAIERTPENPNVQVTYRMLGTDGSIVWVEKTAHAFFDEDGKMVRMIGMISAVTERKRAEETLRQSEEKFRSVFRDAGVGMVIVSPEGRYLAANGTFCDYLGYTEKELLGKTVQSLTFAEDWPSFSQKLNEALTNEGSFQSFEKRCLHKSGRIVCTESTASVIRSRDGNPQYIVGGVLDITKRKEAEEALSTINRRLTEAQEQERTRIARELHDDFSQRLALLAVELDELRQNPPILPEIRRRMGGLHKQVSEIATDIQTLSHELHSSKLEYLGIAAAVRGFCQEFSEQQDVEIDLRSHDLPSSLSPDISLCLFRVLQEAVHNSAKHSGVRHVEVRLWGTSDEIHLAISDSGAGFDSEAAKKGRGLGLISMEERLKLLKGTFSIESQTKRGTTIHARVPFSSGSDSMRAAG
jgi:PAS domain S-box-containing protein